jgi:hypothetical protein
MYSGSDRHQGQRNNSIGEMYMKTMKMSGGEKKSMENYEIMERGPLFRF